MSGAFTAHSLIGLLSQCFGEFIARLNIFQQATRLKTLRETSKVLRSTYGFCLETVNDVIVKGRTCKRRLFTGHNLQILLYICPGQELS
jgi:hypothetical protein